MSWLLHVLYVGVYFLCCADLLLNMPGAPCEAIRGHRLSVVLAWMLFLTVLIDMLVHK